MAPQRMLMKGTEAIAESAIRAGCRYFFGYPITPQNEIPEYMARRLPAVGGTYLQAESEVGAINMLFGAGGSGARVMTSSSSPGIALMAEGASYMAGAEIPAVIVDIMRGGPGLGGISPAQADWSMVTRGLGHGDKRFLVLAPSTVQEAVDLMALAFEKADEYRNPVLMIGDGLIGQMMEPVTFPEGPAKTVEKSWATTGKAGRNKNLIRSLRLDPEELELHVRHLFEKFDRMTEREQRHEALMLGDRPTLVLVAYGTTARICRSAVAELRRQGIAAGLFRPITAWPFPSKALRELVETTRSFLCVEMSMGQMTEDVRGIVGGAREVRSYYRVGGMVPTVDEIVAAAKEAL